ncbi:MAG: hypothetical protein OFPI_38960 [Osedax symbiont Rs2]|nr:MAG: hypothetical protein OFPI_38960 [Osedax symbiont Rs2]
MGITEYKSATFSIGWLMFGYCAALLPLFEFLPVWMLGLAVLTLCWQLQIYRNKITAPTKILKFLLVISSVGMLFYSLGNLFSLRGFVGLLCLAFCLKLLELQAKKDLYLLVFLGSFVSACQLLFSSSMSAFFYALICILIFHGCLITSQLQTASLQPQKKISAAVKSPLASRHWRTAKSVLIIFIQALPVAAVLFIVMPRIGSLWQVPINSSVAKTGVSEHLSLGDISRLNQDHSPAMRVTFNTKNVPDNSQLYWRGIVLADFDGKTWRRAAKVSSTALSTTQRSQLHQYARSPTAQTYSYQIMLEASGQNWLYALNTAQAGDRQIKQWQDYSLTRSTVLNSRFQYELRSHLSFKANLEPLSAQQFQLYPALPKNSNPASRALAEKLSAEYSDSRQLIDALMRMFQSEFSYTLEPGAMATKNPIDDFLFSAKRGYCEHFASSAAFVFRAAGIPARIATGYQGGQWSSDASYLLVTQAAAHAWVEVWLANRGWVRIDPTTAVAPQRIEQGASGYLAQLQSSTGLSTSFRQWGFLTQLRLRLDNINYQWHRWVLGYDNQLQYNFLKQLLGAVDAWRIGLLLLLAGAVTVFPIALLKWWRSRMVTPDKNLESIARLEKQLKKLGLLRARGETLACFLRRSARQNFENKQVLSQLLAPSNMLLSGPPQQADEVARERIQQLLKKLKY